MALISCFIFFSLLVLSTAIDTFESTQPIKDGDSIVSAGGYFKLGFFSPGNSMNRYVGIWFNIADVTPVWVANREIPLTNSSGVLTVTNQGITLLSGNNATIWSSSNSPGSTGNLVAQLLDTGNLVLRERNEVDPQKYVWQSFDYPTDTLLAGMKLGRNDVTGVERHLTAWMSDDNPAKGNYTLELDPRGFPQLVMKKNMLEQYYCSGPWNGLRFSGTPNIRSSPYYTNVVVLNHEEAYYTYEIKESKVKTRLMIIPKGELYRFIWDDQNKNWTLYLKQPKDICEKYGVCGAYGRCEVNNSVQCECLEKFQPRYPDQWDRADWTHGCVRRKPLDCQKGDRFIRYKDIKLPDTRNSSFDRTLSLEECKMVCMGNCSCVAYTGLDISTESTASGCLRWFGELINMRENTQSGQEIYIRVASSEVGSPRKQKWIAFSVSFVVIAMLISVLIVTLYVRKNKQRMKKQLREEMVEHIEGSPEESDTNFEIHKEENLELPIFDYSTIANATDNFSTNNKIGEGGFGPVYKGMLKHGQEIAVKKLSKSSKQGNDEFKNEVLCIAKLQHRNLVRLLGCCIQGEKMLIYEYMPNRSLDFFIFNQERRALLDWPKLFNIINGISRGLLYLHQDSRLRIIHRDLKASNILLDDEMNPKISDFGMARSFLGNETEAETTRVVGTYGYMSPEYAVDGLFSVKSDVFSFGVLVLEIVRGKKTEDLTIKNTTLTFLATHGICTEKESHLS